MARAATAYKRAMGSGNAMMKILIGSREGTGQTFMIPNWGIEIRIKPKRIAALAAADSGANTAIRAVTLGDIIDEAVGYSNIP